MQGVGGSWAALVGGGLHQSSRGRRRESDLLELGSRGLLAGLRGLARPAKLWVGGRIRLSQPLTELAHHPPYT